MDKGGKVYSVYMCYKVLCSLLGVRLEEGIIQALLFNIDSIHFSALCTPLFCIAISYMIPLMTDSSET